MESSNPNPSSNPEPGKRKKLFIILMLLGSLIAAVVFFFPRKTGQGTTVEEKKQPLLQRDEPTRDQIFQEDYKEKVHELLDSGKTVTEISKETGIRKDVVRKIKKGKE